MTAMRDYLEKRERDLEERINAMLKDRETMLAALIEAQYAMEDRDIFGDDPRVSAAINRVKDVIRKVAPAAAEVSAAYEAQRKEMRGQRA